jgi:hypothetical protein
MFRTIAVIVAAIRFAQPQVAEDESRVIANALQEQALAHDFDPLTGVSIIHFESNFDAKVISKNGEDYGLGQIRARYIGACKTDPDPKDNPGPECRKVKAKLLDPEENIRVMAELITANRKFCKAKVGSSAFARWLASYQGRNNKRKKQWCKPGDGTHKVIRYRQTLLLELGKMKELKAELRITKPPAESAKKPEPKKQDETNSRAKNREATAPPKDKSDPKKRERAPSKDDAKKRERAPSKDAPKDKSEERKRRESSSEKEKSKDRR